MHIYIYTYAHLYVLHANTPTYRYVYMYVHGCVHVAIPTCLRFLCPWPAAAGKTCMCTWMMCFSNELSGSESMLVHSHPANAHCATGKSSARSIVVWPTASSVKFGGNSGYSRSSSWTHSYVSSVHGRRPQERHACIHTYVCLHLYIHAYIQSRYVCVGMCRCLYTYKDTCMYEYIYI